MRRGPRTGIERRWDDAGHPTLALYREDGVTRFRMQWDTEGRVTERFVLGERAVAG